MRLESRAVSAQARWAVLYQRFASRGEAGFATKVLSAMGYEFGGHEEELAGRQGGA